MNSQQIVNGSIENEKKDFKYLVSKFEYLLKSTNNPLLDLFLDL